VARDNHRWFMGLIAAGAVAGAFIAAMAAWRMWEIFQKDDPWGDWQVYVTTGVILGSLCLLCMVCPCVGILAQMCCLNVTRKEQVKQQWHHQGKLLMCDAEHRSELRRIFFGPVQCRWSLPERWEVMARF